MGLKSFYTDSDGNTVDNPRFLRKSKKKLKRLHRRVSKKQKKSANRKKARKRLAKAYLKVNRQREDFARKTANALVTSHDLIAYEQLQIPNMVKNHKLAKSIHDAAWGQFLGWMKSYAVMHEIEVVAVPPQYTSQDCSGCGERMQKTLSTRTHVCPKCGLVLDRDENAAVNILAKAVDGTLGHRGTHERVSWNAWGQMASCGGWAIVAIALPGGTKNPPHSMRGSVSYAVTWSDTVSHQIAHPHPHSQVGTMPVAGMPATWSFDDGLVLPNSELYLQTDRNGKSIDRLNLRTRSMIGAIRGFNGTGPAGAFSPATGHRLALNGVAVVRTDAKASHQGYHFQAKFAMRQCPTPFFFGTVGHLLARAPWLHTTTHHHRQLPQTISSGHATMAVVADPQRLTALLARRFQRGRALIACEASGRGVGRAMVLLPALLFLLLPTVKRTYSRYDDFPTHR